MKRCSLVILFSLALFICPLVIKAQANYGKVTAVYIYQFTKNVAWPEEASVGAFNIGVIGDSPALEELQKMAQRLKVGGQRPIVIKRMNSSDEIAAQQYHVLLVSRKEQKLVKDLAQQLSQLPVLLISEGYGLTQKGSLISIYLDDDDGKIKFELNRQALEQHHLQVSNELLKLAAAVL